MTTRKIPKLALLGGAALTLPAASQAGVIYSGLLNTMLSPQGSGAIASLNIDLNSDGINDFALVASNSVPGPSFPYVDLNDLLSTSSIVAAQGNVINVAGLIVGPGSGFDTTASGDTIAGIKSSFGNGQDGYAGLTFTAAGQTYYGWARINASIAAPDGPGGGTAAATLRDFAYEDSGASIQVPGGSDAPEPASLSLFALGAAGLALIHRRRKAAAR